MNEIIQKIKSLFSSQQITQIFVRDLLFIPLEEWQTINNGKIRFKIVEKTDNYLILITEWLEDDVLNKHYHEDANESIFVIKGKIESVMDKIYRNTFGKINYRAGTVHEVYGKKGTLISVKFDFI